MANGSGFNGNGMLAKLLLAFSVPALVAAGSFGFVQSTASSAEKKADKNTERVNNLEANYSRIDERTKNILIEQREVKDAIKEVLREIRK